MVENLNGMAYTRTLRGRPCYTVNAGYRLGFLSGMTSSAMLGARSRSERAALPTGSIPPATLGSPLMSGSEF